jgi:hypothetical protein
VSEETHCDVCKKTGRRRRLTWAPDGWSYAEVDAEGEVGSDGKPLVLIVLACSAACRSAFWLKGPGKMDPDEVLRA